MTVVLWQDCTGSEKQMMFNKMRICGLNTLSFITSTINGSCVSGDLGARLHRLSPRAK